MSRPFAHRFMLPVAALAWLAPLALAQNDPAADPDPRLDAQTGALKANWPPATPWDHLHMLLEVDFGDLSKAEFRAVLYITAAMPHHRVLMIRASGSVSTRNA